MTYSYEISSRASSNIIGFYRNVAKKYRHTYSFENLTRNIHKALSGIFGIDQTLLRRRPTISRWQGHHMAKAGQWYYACTISGDTITVHDACHAQTMHEDTGEDIHEAT